MAGYILSPLSSRNETASSDPAVVFITIATRRITTCLKAISHLEEWRICVHTFLLISSQKLNRMEADTLHLDIDYVGSSGIILSTEQKAALQSSLVILKSNYKYKRVLFWGKIFGVKNDYFIVQGIGMDELKDRHSLYRLVIITDRRLRHWGRYCHQCLYCYFQSRLCEMGSSSCRHGTDAEELCVRQRKIYWRCIL